MEDDWSGLEEAWSRVGVDWRGIGGGFEEDWRRTGGGLEQDRGRIAEELEED